MPDGLFYFYFCVRVRGRGEARQKAERRHPSIIGFLGRRNGVVIDGMLPALSLVDDKMCLAYGGAQKIRGGDHATRYLSTVWALVVA